MNRLVVFFICVIGGFAQTKTDQIRVVPAGHATAIDVAGIEPGGRVVLFDGVRPAASIPAGEGSGRRVLLSLAAGRHEVIAFQMDSSGKVASNSRVAVEVNPKARPVATAAPITIGNISSPSEILRQDFNSDGIDDLAVGSSSGEISIFLGDAQAHFRFAGSWGVGAPVDEIAAADLFGSGSAALLALTGDGRICALPGNGDGTFGTVQALDTNGIVATSFVIGDFNEDGSLDIALTEGNGSVVLIGRSSAGKGVSTLISSAAASHLALIDAAGDQHAGLAYLSASGLQVLAGHGDGTFAAPVNISGPAAFTRLTSDASGRNLFALDAQGGISTVALRDGRPFLETTTAAGAGWIQGGDFMGNGSPAVALTNAAGEISVLTTGSSSADLETFRADGAVSRAVPIDGGIAVLDSRAGTISVLGLSPEQSKSNSKPASLIASASTSAIESPAIATAGASTSSVSLSVSPSPASFGKPATLTATVSPSSATGKVSFYDGANIIGVAPLSSGKATFTTSMLAAGVRTLSARYGGDATYASSVSANVSTTVTAVGGTGYSVFTPYTVSQPNWIIAADFNGDGKADVAYTVANGVGVAMGKGDGTLQTPTSYNFTQNPWAVIAGDFNLDGKQDLAFSDDSGKVQILIGKGDGTFTLQAKNYLAGLYLAGMVNGDFNRDGIPDIAVVDFLSASVGVLLGKGDGSFQNPVTYTAGDGATAVVTADFNRDGKPDLAVVNENANNVSILLGNGDGTFGPAQNAAVGLNPLDIAVADLNNDGNSDLLIANSGDNTVGVLKGAGNGSFTYTSYNVGNAPLSVAPSDFNGDGKLDVVVANYYGNGVYIVPGDGSGALTTSSKSFYSAGIGPAYVAVADFNGDSEADLAIVDTGDSSGHNSSVGIMVSGSCWYTAAPNSVIRDSTGGTGTLALTTLAPSCAWTAASDASWVTLSPPSGTGNATINYTIAANSTGLARTANLTIGGYKVTVTEDATAQYFTDVTPADYYFDAVNTMQIKGITSGCSSSPAKYCPLDTITRAQMAVFLVRGVIGNDNFSYNSTPYFTDVGPNDFGFKWIQKLYELQVTAGCGPGLFCPNDPVARDQMAAFIIRARLGPTATYYYPPAAYFSDVPSNYWDFAAVQRMKYDSITSGCSDTQYCPASAVTRGDMALFVIRGMFNQLLPVTNAPIISSISPSTVTRGQNYSVSIVGSNTHFANGSTQFAPIPGVTISNVSITSATTITAQFNVSSSASAQPESVRVITGTEEPVIPNGLKIQ
jgi:hypothetical protein